MVWQQYTYSDLCNSTFHDFSKLSEINNSLLHHLKKAARGISVYVNSDKTQFMYFKEGGTRSVELSCRTTYWCRLHRWSSTSSKYAFTIWFAGCIGWSRQEATLISTQTEFMRFNQFATISSLNSNSLILVNFGSKKVISIYS